MTADFDAGEVAAITSVCSAVTAAVALLALKGVEAYRGYLKARREDKLSAEESEMKRSEAAERLRQDRDSAAVEGLKRLSGLLEARGDALQKKVDELSAGYVTSRELIGSLTSRVEFQDKAVEKLEAENLKCEQERDRCREEGVAMKQRISYLEEQMNERPPPKEEIA